jgi:DNA-binding MarR family transcriptional regulator
MKYKISELKKHIGFWMRLVSNNVSYAFARKLENTGVTVPEWVVLREMLEAGDSIAPSQIAEMTGMTRGAVTKLIDKLLDKKLVTRKESLEDRRYQELKLTSTAKQLIPKLAVLADENDEEYFSVLTKEERKTLTNILIKTAKLNKLTKFPIE